MAIPLPKQSGDFEVTPAGTFNATCYRIIDKGTQEVVYQGDKSFKHQIMLSWELHDEDAVTRDGRPMTVHKTYTFSMHKKAGLRKDLEAWRGKAFTDADFGEDGFDIAKLLKAPCLIGVTHTERDGETYANISSISRLPKGMSPGKLVNDPVLLWLDPTMWDNEIYEGLSESLRKKIASSPEYKELFGGKPDKQIAADFGGSSDDDEIPF